MSLALVFVPLLSLVALAGTGSAQDLNINFGPPPVPTPAYGAASGQIGHWNSLVFPSGVTPLLDLAGHATGVTAAPSSSMWCDMYDCSACSSGCPGTFVDPDDQKLLGSWINADCGLSVTQFGFAGLEAGRYAAYVYTYGCPQAPAASTQLVVGSTVFGFSTPGVAFQGSWSGFPIGRHVFNLSSGFLTLSCWGTNETGLAGLQLEKLDPVGQATCLGDGSGGSCPCANFGLPGHGCRNSATIRGAELGAVGSASLAFDTLGFGATFEPPNVISVLLQGNQLIAPAVFGDGLRCVGGSLKRLVIANASATGALDLPLNGALSISARSALLGDALAPGNVRGYQLYYRDPDPAWCPAPQGSTYNISNAVEIIWKP